MKRKQKVDLIIAIFLILIGVTLMIFPNFKILDLEVILFSVMMAYATLNLIQFIFTRDSKDYEGLFTSIFSYLIGVGGLYFDLFNGGVEMVAIILAWIILMSLVKFKKCDYYHDRYKKIYILKIVTLILFILIGFLSVINLYYEAEVQILVLGFFYFIHGVLELVDPITNFLIRTK